jgi:DNA-binding GntR family transcriptional regulator
MVNKVTVALRSDILADVFPAGSRLVEADLCERYQTGRSVVRAALLALSGEGLVRKEANRGATVRRISVKEAIEVTEARAVLEGLIAACAAHRITDKQTIILQDVVTRMRRVVEEEQAFGYRELNEEFHARIREFAHHQVAASLVENLTNRAVHHQFRLSTIPGRAIESLAQHQAIADAIIARDPQAAAESMTAHLNSIVSVLNRWADYDDIKPRRI